MTLVVHEGRMRSEGVGRSSVLLREFALQACAWGGAFRRCAGTLLQVPAPFPTAQWPIRTSPLSSGAWLICSAAKGCEIPFNRHFYVFQPPRPLAEIDAALKACTDRILTLIGGLSH